MSKFVYHNINPYRIEEEDCVCRAISLALNIDYNAIKNLLEMSADLNECDTLCICCYHHLLEDVFDLPVYYCNFNETVEDIASKYTHNRLIIRIDGHLTCAINGIIYDLWDCTKKNVDCFWIAY